MQARMAETGGRPPAEGTPGMLGRADVHRPIDQHVERQSTTGAELERANAAFGAVIEHHAAYATQRAWIAGQSRQPGSIEVLSVDSHGSQAFSMATRCRGVAERNDPGELRGFPATGA